MGLAVNLQGAIAFVRDRGIVLESARGSAPSLAEAIVGESIHGNWWSHPRSKEIFRITRAIRASDSILVCRLIASKVTFVHRRLWPAIVRVGAQIPPPQLAQLHERHTASGEHALVEVPFPAWVTADVLAEAALVGEDAAWDIIRSCVPGPIGSASQSRPRRLRDPS